MPSFKLPLAAVLMTIALAPAAVAQEAPSKEAIEKIVHDYILANPEVIVEAMSAMQERQQRADEQKARAAIDENYEAIAMSPDDPIAGNESGDVVIVEFFDYRCPYCRRVVDPLMQTIKEDGNIKLVFKEFPILGPDSVVAARAALAAKRQDKYVDFHRALMESETRVSSENLFTIAKSVGLDIDRLKADMELPEIASQIKDTYGLADALGIGGTPAFIIGKELVPGAITMDEIKRRVAAARGAT
jgi:protein-disulfide isomerase